MLKGTIVLRNPITINGKKVNELTYDANEITPAMFAEADARKMLASGAKSGNLSGAVELDYGLHLYLGFAAIIAVNPEIDFTDLERIKGPDVMQVMKVGRNFIISSAASEEDSSDEQSEITPELSTHQSQTSKEKE
ncbi:hypothetical protein CTHBC1_2671 [Acetivibrio thermocellus BC1]|nr:hypothetical protein CTHBC1_2671 [Acetivibrio thermocellus BC1]